MAILLKTWMNMVVVKMDGTDFEMVLISLCFSRVTVIRGQVVTTSGRGLVGVRITRYQQYQTISIYLSLFLIYLCSMFLDAFSIQTSFWVDPSSDSFI